MAAPITHIVLADKVLKNLPNISRKEFFIGTSFPDIRYIRVIERDKTHAKDISLEDIKNKDSFQAGFLLHSLVDTLQVAYHLNHKNERAPEKGLMLQAFKLFEDKVLYEKLSDWNTIAGYMDSVLPQETELVANKDNVVKWHNILKDYMSQAPSPESRAPFFKELYFTPEQTQQIEEYIKEMESDPTLVTFVENFYRDTL